MVIATKVIIEFNLSLAKNLLFLCNFLTYVSFYTSFSDLLMYFVCVSSQVSGPSGQMSWIRNGPESLDAWNITEAIDNRLSNNR